MANAACPETHYNGLQLDVKRDGRQYIIVAVGGGTGLSTMLRGLKKYSRNITAILTVGDDGGIQLGLDTLQTFKRIEHGTLEIDRVDFAGDGKVFLRQIENLIRCHALGHRQFGEGIRRDRGDAGFGQVSQLSERWLLAIK